MGQNNFYMQHFLRKQNKNNKNVLFLQTKNFLKNIIFNFIMLNNITKITNNF